MMLGIAAISLWCLTLLMQGRLLGLRLYWTMCATIFLINVLNHVDLSFNLLLSLIHIYVEKKIRKTEKEIQRLDKRLAQLKQKTKLGKQTREDYLEEVQVCLLYTSRCV